MWIRINCECTEYYTKSSNIHSRVKSVFAVRKLLNGFIFAEMAEYIVRAFRPHGGPKDLSLFYGAIGGFDVRIQPFFAAGP